MASATLIFQKINAKLDSVVLDVSVSERHQAKADITRHPVEQGVAIVDHIRPQPRTLQLEGVVTNTPLPAPNTELTQKFSHGVQYQSLTEIVPTRSSDAFAALTDLFQAGRLFTVVTSIRTYENMALENLEIPRDASTGQILRFTASLVEVKTVATAQTVSINLKRKTSIGTKATTPTPPATEAESALLTLNKEATATFGYDFAGAIKTVVGGR